MVNLYILTEERPKPNVIEKILKHYCKIYGKQIFLIEKIQIQPIFKLKKFYYEYKVLNIQIENIHEIIIRIVSGVSTFVDYLIFEQNSAPKESDINNEYDGNNIKLLLEETKTNDIESRNQVFQRISKFIYATHFYKNVKQTMFYNIQIEYPKKDPTYSNKLGMNILLTLGINIIGVDTSNNKKFESIQELIEFKNKMNLPNVTNTPITITQKENKIFITGNLENPKGSGNLKHDPNMGQLPALIKVIRMFNSEIEIIIQNHGVKQETINRSRGNKFLFLSKILNFKLENIELPKINIPKQYWKYNKKLEKNGTILIHLANIFKNEYITSIFENHGGGELSYFHYPDHNIQSISERNIPDLVLKNDQCKEILIIEGKKYEKVQEGLDKLEKFDSFETKYVKTYENYTINRWVVTCGETISKTDLNPKILFHLNEDGECILNEHAPQWIKESFERVINY